MNQETKKSINTPQQWACKSDAFLFNEYEYTSEEIDELHSDSDRQRRRETSKKIIIWEDVWEGCRQNH